VTWTCIPSLDSECFSIVVHQVSIILFVCDLFLGAIPVPIAVNIVLQATLTSSGNVAVYIILYHQHDIKLCLGKIWLDKGIHHGSNKNAAIIFSLSCGAIVSGCAWQRFLPVFLFHQVSFSFSFRDD